MRTEVYRIEGMSCAACSSAVERVTRKLDGVESSQVNLIMEKMTITYDESRVDPKRITAAVEKAGFGIKPDERARQNGSKKQEKKKEQKSAAEDKENSAAPIIASCILSALLLYISMGHMLIESLPLPAIIRPENYPVNFALTQMILAACVLFIGKSFLLAVFMRLCI